ncbi:NADPH-dependent FMN reductase [Hoeflea sp.]|uniref:NADPH-dependent FMN reductase n=1 Tax=Hoeflea sp. TaxID=1940281 RepID=UPI003A93B7A2
MTQVLFIPGSLRQASSSRATVRALVKCLEPEITCRVADPGLLPHYNADIGNDPAVEEFIVEVAAADGVVFVTPEYNYSIPGVLKNAIDWASRPAYNSVFKDKPCFIVSVSGGALGGVRAQAHLKYILNGMLARPFACQEIVIPQANAKIADGYLADKAILEFAELNLRAFVSSL